MDRIKEVKDALVGLTSAGGATMSGLTRRPLPDEDKRDLRRMLSALEPFRVIRSTMPLQYVHTLLLVATDEGRGVGDYALKAGVSQSVMSRHLLDLGERNRHMEAGFGLVMSRLNPMELRKKEFYLTPQGRAVVNAIINAIRK